VVECDAMGARFDAVSMMGISRQTLLFFILISLDMIDIVITSFIIYVSCLQPVITD